MIRSMRTLLFFFSLTYSIAIMAQQPSMQIWTDAWHSAQPDTFQNVYAADAIIFPPHKPPVSGNGTILAFMRGGLGKVDVVFEPLHQTIGETLSFEHGIFKDLKRGSSELIGQGHYTVTWVLIHGEWKILCHHWTAAE